MVLSRSIRNFIILVITSLCCYTHSIYAQTDIAFNKLSSVTDVESKIIDGLQKKYSKLQSQVDRRSGELLSRMQAKENGLHRKLNGVDSIKANELFNAHIKQRYTDLQLKLTNATVKLSRFPLKEYMPGLDSVQTALIFLQQNKNLTDERLQQIESLGTQIKSLEAKLQAANDIQKFVREREVALKERLMNTALVKQVRNINKQIYYYGSRLSEYKALLNNKEKFKEKLLNIVSALPAFQKFWQRNSFLEQLFPAPGNYQISQALTGLQTRNTIQNIMAQRIGNGSAGMNSQQYFQQQANRAESQMNEWKEKINDLGNNSSSEEIIMPEFRPNEQKTKTFLQRVQYGFNIQSIPGYSFLPATSDVAVTLGYKFSDSKIFGLGASYKMGWGNGWDQIKLTSQGIGLRSFADIKAKGSFWLTGGFEYNYLSAFTNFRSLQSNIDVWQRSALLGLGKKYKIGKKKEGNVQVLYDFLHNQQNPPSPGLKFRIGWAF